MVTVYHLGLRNVTYDDAEAAVVECIETCTFMPTVAEIREKFPRQPGMNSALYRRFAALHGKAETSEELREYAAICKALGVAWLSSEYPAPVERKAVS